MSINVVSFSRPYLTLLALTVMLQLLVAPAYAAAEKAGLSVGVESLAKLEFWGGLGLIVLLAAVVLMLLAQARAIKRVNRELEKRAEALLRENEERRRVEAALQKANYTLEQRVAERTAELERSNKDLESFAYLASHDLQAPLRQVVGMMNILQERYRGRLDAKADECIGFAVGGAKQMSALITDLLAYSRAGNKELETQAINLQEPLYRAITLLRPAIDESGARIIVADLPRVQAHVGQLAQVFENLISNAIKFRSERPLEVEINAKRDGGQWLIAVKDNGIGIDPKHSDKAFELFRRLHDRSKYSGTGIGLAICKKIIERHGGRIWVESEPGKGSTFYFTLAGGLS